MRCGTRNRTAGHVGTGERGQSSGRPRGRGGAERSAGGAGRPTSWPSFWSRAGGAVVGSFADLGPRSSCAVAILGSAGCAVLALGRETRRIRGTGRPGGGRRGASCRFGQGNRRDQIGDQRIGATC